MKAFFLLICLTLTSAWGGEDYKYRIWVKDASNLKQLSDKNSWVQKFYDDVLYQGLMIRLAPFLFAVGQDNKSAWKGRLIDFIFENILANHSLSVSYYASAGSASPVGITIYGLSETENALIKVFSDFFGEKNADQKISMINFRNNKIGFAIHHNCLSLARNPLVVEKLAAEDCSKFQFESDAVLRIKTEKMFSSFYPLLKNFVGVNGDIDLNFKWNNSKSNFVADEAKIKLLEKNIFRKEKLPINLFNAIPTEAGLWGLINLADMRPLDKESLKNYFLTQGKGKDNTGVPVVYMFLGMEKNISKTVLLIPYQSFNQEAQNKLVELFNETGTYEVKFKHVCKDILALSPSLEALAQVEGSCAKKNPRFVQWSDKYEDAMSEALSGAAFVHMGILTSQSLKLGSPPEIQSTDEYKKSLSLLTELPHFLWTGIKDGKDLMMKGIDQ